MKVIDKFFGHYRFLSNFYRTDIKYDGMTYPTVEHAYQASKSIFMQDKIKIKNCETPGQAKRLSKSLFIRDDWYDINIGIMNELIRIKFSNPKLRGKLLATDDAILIEGNSWGDRFWGTCNGQGQNHLGIILMTVRSELRGDDV